MNNVSGKWKDQSSERITSLNPTTFPFNQFTTFSFNPLIVNHVRCHKQIMKLESF